MNARIFPTCFPPRLVWRNGVGQLAPDWWMRGVTRSGVRNAPFLGSFARGSGAENGAERRAEPRSTKGGQHTWLVVRGGL